MELVPGFVCLLPGLAVTMTAPTFESLRTVLTSPIAMSLRLIRQRTHVREFEDGADRLGVCSPADGDADDPGGG